MKELIKNTLPKTVDNYYKTNTMLEKKLHEELMRYKAINKYGQKMIMEQDAPEDAALPAEDPTATPEVPTPDVAPDAAPDAAEPTPALETGGDSDTEEIDITDLVNMTKSIKNNIDDNKADHGAVLSKMDDVFTKLNDLETKLSQMDSVMAKIDQLGAKVEAVKEPTPQEKLEMRSLDSYPFNTKPTEFFNQKQGEMQASGKNEYVLTKDDVDNYSPETIRNTFNPEEDEIKF